MADPVPSNMRADEFVAWASRQAAGRYELVRGRVLAMAPERVDHTRVKAELWLALRNAIAAGNLPCEALTNGLSVRIDDETVYEPDAVVRCGPPLPGDSVEANDPIIVAEVLSPSTRGRDSGAKLEDYFRLPSVRHYLLVKTDSRSVIHHRRVQEGDLRTTIISSGVLALDPPGLKLQLADLFQGL